MNKITKIEYDTTLKEQFADKVKRIGKFTNMTLDTKHCCYLHGDFIWTPRKVARSKFGCPKCGWFSLGDFRRLTSSDYQKRLDKKFGKSKYTLNTNYKNQSTKVELTHLLCKNTFTVLPFDFLNSKGCKVCSGKAPLTKDKALKLLKEKFQHITLKHGQKFSLKSLVYLCSFHGEYSTKYYNILHSTNGCPECGKDAKRFKPSVEQTLKHIEDLKIVNPKLEVIGEYRGSLDKRTKYRCTDCSYIWETKYVRFGSDCPVCAGVSRIKNRSTLKHIEVEGKKFSVQGFEPQALQYLVNTLYYPVSDIFNGCVEVPVINYRYGKKDRRYYPDFFISSDNLVVEVKSTATMGLRPGSMFSTKSYYLTRAKKLAVRAQGYRFKLLIMSESGKKYKLPKQWHVLNLKDFKKEFKLLNEL